MLSWFIRDIERTSILDLYRTYRSFGRKNNIVVSVSSLAYTLRSKREMGYLHEGYKSFPTNNFGLNTDYVAVYVIVSIEHRVGFVQLTKDHSV